jgi:hypothetical protein
MVNKSAFAKAIIPKKLLNERLQPTERCEYEYAMEDNQRLAALRAKYGDFNTLSDFLKNIYRPKLTVVARRMPSGKGDIFLRHTVRYFDPWPDWVLGMIIEILRVHVPTIPKSTINDTVRFVHNFIFAYKLDGSTPKDLFKIPEFGAPQVGASLGHLAALAEKLLLRVTTEFEQNSISSEDYKSYADSLSLERMQIETQPYMELIPTGLFEFAVGFANAKQNTFDKQGWLRETTLTRIYGEIVENWPEIEELSGPTALCNFLSPVLKGNDNSPEMRLDRVNKICQRMGVRFQPFVKE